MVLGQGDEDEGFRCQSDLKLSHGRGLNYRREPHRQGRRLPSHHPGDGKGSG